MNYMVGGVSMKYPIIVGAGVCKTQAVLKRYMRSDASYGAVTYGSTTPLRREENTPKPVIFPEEVSSPSTLGVVANSYGMPNEGVEEEKRQLDENAPYSIPVVQSIAWFDPEGCRQGLNTYAKGKGFVPAAMDLNAGCPNSGHLPPSLDLGAMERVLEIIASDKWECPIWLKLSAYVLEEDQRFLSQFVDTMHITVVSESFIEEMLGLIATYRRHVHAVVVPNTVGNIIHHVNRKPVTGPFGGKAGLSGPLLRDIARRQTELSVKKFRPAGIDTISMGGILDGDEACLRLNMGAAAFACTTLPHLFGGPKVFGEMIAGSERLQNHLSSI